MDYEKTTVLLREDLVDKIWNKYDKDGTNMKHQINKALEDYFKKEANK